MGENDNREEESNLAKQIREHFQHRDRALGMSSNTKDLHPAWRELLERKPPEDDNP